MKRTNLFKKITTILLLTTTSLFLSLSPLPYNDTALVQAIPQNPNKTIALQEPKRLNRLYFTNEYWDGRAYYDLDTNEMYAFKVDEPTKTLYFTKINDNSFIPLFKLPPTKFKKDSHKDVLCLTYYNENYNGTGIDLEVTYFPQNDSLRVGAAEMCSLGNIYGKVPNVDLDNIYDNKTYFSNPKGVQKEIKFINPKSNIQLSLQGLDGKNKTVQLIFTKPDEYNAQGQLTKKGKILNKYTIPFNKVYLIPNYNTHNYKLIFDSPEYEYGKSLIEYNQGTNLFINEVNSPNSALLQFYVGEYIQLPDLSQIELQNNN